MAFITVSNIFVNATTASASEINTNFTDLINGTSDGTKDFSIAALTCSGTLTANGDVTLGNSSSDTLTLTAALGSSIVLDTTYAYDIGSTTVGIKGLFFGSADSAAYASKIVAGTLTASNTLTLPTTTGTLALTHDASREIRNLSIACSVGSSALTIAVKDKSGSDASSSSPIYVGFRSATAATGTYNQRSITGALSMTVSSGSTLGHTSGNAHYIYVYLLDNSGTLELAVSQSLYSDLSIVSTSAEGGAGGADSNSTIYSTTARSNVPIRLVARLTSTQTTAGTWAVVPTEISLCTFALSGNETVVLRAQKTSSQSVSNSSWTVLSSFDTATIDTCAMFVASTGIATFPTAGKYRVTAKCGFGSSGTGIRGVRIYRNASTYGRVLSPALTGDVTVVTCTDIMTVAAGDTTKFEVYQSSGGSLGTSTDTGDSVFMIERIGA